jgi:hypothetical protein
MSIPRRLIQIRAGKSRDLSPFARAAVTNLKLLHPDWEYQCFDDDGISRFVSAEFPEYRHVLEAFRYPIQRYDFFRYLVIFRFGGFYFDLDVLLSRPVTDLLDNESVFPFEELTLNRFLRRRYKMDWELANYGFGAAPGNRFLHAVIENCIRAQTDFAWLRPMMRGVNSLSRSEFYVFNTTGPGLVSRTFAERVELASSVKVLFPDNVCDRANWHLFGDYGVHMMTSSWLAGGNWLWRRIAGQVDAFSRARLLPESLRLGPKRDIPMSRSSAEERGARA